MPDILIRKVGAELHAAIETAAKADGRSMTEMIRRAIRAAFLPDSLPPKARARRQSTPVDDERSYLAFADWWALYPPGRKRAKADAEKAWRALAPDAALARTMCEALDAQCSWPEWRKDGGKFVPYPATWIRGRRWEDEPPEVAPAAPGQPDYYSADLSETCQHDPPCGSKHAHRMKVEMGA